MKEQRYDVKEQKQKLTLGIDRTVIERAKDAGINISFITEELLVAITYQPKEGNTNSDIFRAYEVLFNAIRNITEDYGTQFETGIVNNRLTDYKDSPLYFDPVGGFFVCEDNSDVVGHQFTLLEAINYFYKPSKILSNLILALTRSAESNKKRVMELEMALKFVEVLAHSGDSVSKPSPRKIINEPKKQ